jgi:uncharacterized membrane protein YbaN (DUF454 family)
VRLFWNVAGTIFLAIGIAGVILPLLPGTVFLIAASFCYLRGSERLHSWLMNHPVLGRHLRAVRTGMPLRAKVIALLMMWTAIGFSLTRLHAPAAQATFVILGAIGTFFIVRQPSPGRVRPE